VGVGITFEWDPKKDAENDKKHGVSFAEAVLVFADPLAKIFDDDSHSIGERRELIVGHASRGRLLIVCFTERPSRVRIISARRLTRRERAVYEENVT
jgi:uncharacterized protein